MNTMNTMNSINYNSNYVTKVTSIPDLKSIQLFNNKLEEFKLELSDQFRFFGLFVTGSWCPPCKEFENILIEFYKEINFKEKRFEIIHMSSEKNEHEFKNSIADIPWPIIKFNNRVIQTLAGLLNIQYIPMLIIVTNNGEIITYDGRKDIVDNKDEAFFKWENEEHRLKELKELKELKD